VFNRCANEGGYDCKSIRKVNGLMNYWEACLVKTNISICYACFLYVFVVMYYLFFLGV
jgi:hypothetical protein